VTIQSETTDPKKGDACHRPVPGKESADAERGGELSDGGNSKHTAVEVEPCSVEG
jgi:hypothetical protein